MKDWHPRRDVRRVKKDWVRWSRYDLPPACRHLARRERDLRRIGRSYTFLESLEHPWTRVLVRTLNRKPLTEAEAYLKIHFDPDADHRPPRRDAFADLDLGGSPWPMLGGEGATRGFLA